MNISIQILSHRGLWKERFEQNTLDSFIRSFDLQFGIETDLRDRNGEIVVSHNPPTGSEALLGIDGFFSAVQKSGSNLPLALNIKSDGLQELLENKILEYRIKNYFVFDMSIPDTLKWSQKGMRFFTRVSEHEPTPLLLDQASGVWIDCFKSDFKDLVFIQKILGLKKDICFVSPELHQRDYVPFWVWLKENGLGNDKSVSLCTDHPSAAKEFFYGN